MRLILFNILFLILDGIMSLTSFSISWTLDTWNQLKIDELIYQLKAPITGTSEGMIKQYTINCIIPTCVVLIIVWFACFRLKQKRSRKFWIVLSSTIMMLLLGSSLFRAWTQLDIGLYIEGQMNVSTFIEDNYVNPREVQIVFPENKRNLVYVFLESMEITYADVENGGAFMQNVIPELTALAAVHEDFSGNETNLNGALTLPGTTWTMGAMFAHTSGLPLKVNIDGNNMDTLDSFFSDAYTMGDVLNDNGYSQILLIGSDATFGGRRLYFTEHGDYEIIDYNYAIENQLLPEGYKVWWGYEDKKLFSFAKEKLKELSKQNEPFNLTLLTADTHFEDGYVCELCSGIYSDNSYANVMTCSSRQVVDFINWIQEQEFSDNTTIVLCGDHLTMDNDFCSDIGEYERKVYTVYINGAVETNRLSERRIYSTFDFFPTTLASLGVKIDGDKLGLGTNLFSNTETLLEKYDIDTVIAEMNRRSEFMERLANIDVYDKELMEREGKIPTVDIEVIESGIEHIKIQVSEIVNLYEDIQAVFIEQRDIDNSVLNQFSGERQEDSTYIVTINLPLELNDTNKMLVKVKGESGREYYIGEYSLEQMQLTGYSAE